MKFIEDPYFDRCEDICNRYFEQFNDDVKWFKTLKRQPTESGIDYYCIDNKGRVCAVELKTRTNNIFAFETTFIEVEKFDRLMMQYTENDMIPLYMNFYQNGDYVGIFDLREFQCPKLNTVRLFDKGHKEYKVEQRYLLENRKSIYFEKVNNKFKRLW